MSDERNRLRRLLPPPEPGQQDSATSDDHEHQAANQEPGAQMGGGHRLLVGRLRLRPPPGGGGGAASVAVPTFPSDPAPKVTSQGPSPDRASGSHATVAASVSPPETTEHETMVSPNDTDTPPGGRPT